MTKVSIIVPVYNTEKYLTRCLDSLVNQTYKNIEIVLVDDGSTDNSAKILEEYKKVDNRIKIISKKNQGIFMARNTGIDNATGDYVMFVDSDDWIDEEAIEKLVNEISKEEFDIVKYRMIFEPSGRKNDLGVEYRAFYMTNEKDRNKIYNLLNETSNLNNLANQIVKRNLLIKTTNNNKISQGEDICRNLEIFTNAKSILFIPDCFYHYRTNPESTTHIISKEKIIKNLEDILFLYNVRTDYLKKWGYYNETNLKILAIRLIDYIVSEAIMKLYQLEHISEEEMHNLYKSIYNNEIFIFYTNYLKKEDIKDKNIITRSMKRDILLRKEKIDKKYRKIIKAYFWLHKKIKSRR